MKPEIKGTVDIELGDVYEGYDEHVLPLLTDHYVWVVRNPEVASQRGFVSVAVRDTETSPLNPEILFESRVTAELFHGSIGGRRIREAIIEGKMDKIENGEEPDYLFGYSDAGKRMRELMEVGCTKPEAMDYAVTEETGFSLTEWAVRGKRDEERVRENVENAKQQLQAENAD